MLTNNVRSQQARLQLHEMHGRTLQPASNLSNEKTWINQPIHVGWNRRTCTRAPEFIHVQIRRAQQQLLNMPCHGGFVFVICFYF